MSNLPYEYEQEAIASEARRDRVAQRISVIDQISSRRARVAAWVGIGSGAALVGAVEAAWHKVVDLPVVGGIGFVGVTLGLAAYEFAKSSIEEGYDLGRQHRAEISAAHQLTSAANGGQSEQISVQ